MLFWSREKFNTASATVSKRNVGNPDRPEAGILLESCYSRQVQCVKVCRAPVGAQSSLASISAFVNGVKLSMSRPSAARPGRRWGGTNLWLR